MVVDRVQVACRQCYAYLGEVPIAAVDRPLLLAVDQIAGQEILEILVDVVDEHGERAVDAPEHRQQVRHIILEGGEIGVARQRQEIGEQIAGAAQVLVAHQLLKRAGKRRADAQMLLDRERQRDRPERLPIGLGLAHAAILAMAHQVGVGAGLVDQRPLGEHGAVALPHRLALGLEQQRLAEALGRYDQHLLGRGRIEEIGDLVVQVQQLAVELVEILGLDVLRVDDPRLQRLLPNQPPSDVSRNLGSDRGRGKEPGVMRHETRHGRGRPRPPPGSAPPSGRRPPGPRRRECRARPRRRRPRHRAGP